MPSQTDFDQGGTYRTLTRVWMGPSIGYVEVPSAIVRVTAGGTTTIQVGTTVITVNFNGSVTIQLPVYKQTIPAIAAGAPNTAETVTIIDTGGFAGANPITILPGGSETISGLASIQITSTNGAVVLQPDPVNGGSTVVT